jgi:uncharacterized membrane protein YbjE (DUF340 family)
MLIVLLLFAIGLLIGHLLRGRRIIGWADRLTEWFIFLLLVVMGLSIGSNHEVLSQLDSLGLQAGVLALAAISGSILLVKLVSLAFGWRGR